MPAFAGLNDTMSTMRPRDVAAIGASADNAPVSRAQRPWGCLLGAQEAEGWCTSQP